MNTIIAITIIITVTILISITYALFVSGIITSGISKGLIKAEILECKYAVKTLFLTLANKGSEGFTVTDIFIDDKPANIVWAWDTTSNTYLGNTPYLKPGHRAVIALKIKDQTLYPGLMVSIRVRTSSGQEFYTTLQIDAHPALNYFSNGYFYMWDFDPSKMLAVYREYWIASNTTIYNLPEWVPKLGDSWGGRVNKYIVSFNMWYANLQISGGKQIIFEIGLWNDVSNDWKYIDLEADPEGYLYLYLSGYGNIQLNHKSTDPHNYRFELIVHDSEGVVETKLFIDGKLVVDKNSSSIYDYYIENICFGVWNDASMSILYLDNYYEHIDFYYDYAHNYTLIEDFSTSSKVFTSYVVGPDASPVRYEITSYPVILDGGKMGFSVEK
ncbi:hypothetical protein Smar_0234 [Staphylothermus marinus F1]|uniref:DUF4352 domain-containing protein n=1 Tax=Staphylothermus marinus (strain ATCC 43588 / DSM 3639 / JCM 9404 / F1) TaxID=399550 RepID=A3DL37_STAMF|nr:hypothetical protein [Staphylothermus marinus]ABN69347.1 hypothetical protein Smar_0234 [Staphylothermus marinus F1]